MICNAAFPMHFLLINWDFNNSSLSATLPSLKQMVTCPMREGKIIDLFYRNTKESYSAHSLPPLGKSDQFNTLGVKILSGDSKAGDWL